MTQFDMEVAEIRKNGVEPKCFSRGKANATAEQWAANLEYHKRFGSQAKIKEYRREWYERNQELTRQRTREWQTANPDRHAAFVRKAHLKSYFLTPAQYAGMHSGQGGACAICGSGCVSGNRLAVDHDHQTGAVRGLLCTLCNTAIGKLKDSPALLRKAADYIEAGGTPQFDIVTFYKLATETDNGNN
jgi:hypothetical protein